jgi:hypothetical protein
MTERELGWLAGIMEGEGSFILTNNGRREEEMAMLVVAMTDEDVVRRVHALTGCGRVNGPYMGPGRRKPIYRWRIRNRDDVMYLVKLVLPMLGNRRRKQAQRLLDWDAASYRRYAIGSRATIEGAYA